jgi:hypothetical protein
MNPRISITIIVLLLLSLIGVWTISNDTEQQILLTIVMIVGIAFVWSTTMWRKK